MAGNLLGVEKRSPPNSTWRTGDPPPVCPPGGPQRPSLHHGAGPTGPTADVTTVGCGNIAAALR